METQQDHKKVHVSFRCDEQHRDFLNTLTEEWSEQHENIDNRSDVIRVLHKAFIGLLNGRLVGVLNPEKLRENAGPWGEVLANNMESGQPMPKDLTELTLGDLIENPIVLVGAAESELEEM